MTRNKSKQLEILNNTIRNDADEEDDIEKFRIETPMKKFQFYKIDNFRTAIIAPKQVRNSEQTENTNCVIQQIAEITHRNLFESIAINLDFDDSVSYFNFKVIFREFFKNSTSNVTFFLNKVIDLHN